VASPTVSPPPKNEIIDAEIIDAADEVVAAEVVDTADDTEEYDDSEPSDHQATKVALIVALCVCWTLAILLSVVTSGQGGSDQSKPLRSVAGLLGLAGIVCTVMAVNGAKNKCPECGWWWVKTFVKKKLVDKKRACKTVTRTDKHSGSVIGVGTGGVAAGFGSGTTQRKEQITVLRHYYDNHFRCAHCDHRWVIESEEDAEDFILD
jgi:hypothetical protein